MFSVGDPPTPTPQVNLKDPLYPNLERLAWIVGSSS